MEKKDKEIVVDFYKSLDSILKKKTMTRNRLKKLSGVSLERYKVDGKDMREPNLSSLVKMADALDVSLDELCGRGIFTSGRQLTAYECWRALDAVIKNMNAHLIASYEDKNGIELVLPSSNVTWVFTSAERYEASYRSIKEFDPVNHPLSEYDAKDEYIKKEVEKLNESKAEYEEILFDAEIVDEPDDDGNDSPPPSTEELPF